MNNYFHGVQSLRGIAAILVVLYHTHILFKKEKYFNTVVFDGALEFGHRGVDLFFVISGFVMGIFVFTKTPRSATSYMTDRLLRIFTPYLPLFFVMSLGLAFYPNIFPAAYSGPDYSAIENIFLLPRQNLDTYIPVVAWSLSHELFFYLMTSVLLFSRFGRTIFFIWIILSFINLFFEPTASLFTTFILSKYNIAFGLGLISYRLCLDIRKNHQIAASLVGTSGFILSVFLENSGGYSIRLIYLDILYFVFSALVVIGLAKIRVNVLELIGKFSYSLYLIHYPVLLAGAILLKRYFGSEFTILSFSSLVFLALAAGYAYYKIIELPGYRIKFFLQSKAQ